MFKLLKHTIEDDFYLQGTIILDPQDVKIPTYSLKNEIALNIRTNGKFSVIESSLPLDFVFEHKSRLKTYAGLVKTEIESLVSILKKEKNPITTKLKHTLAHHVDF